MADFIIILTANVTN